MKKLSKILSLIMAAIMIISAMPMTASAGGEIVTTIGVVSYTIRTDGVIVTGSDANATNVEIVESINDIPVTKINDYAFSMCHKLESVAIPDSVTTIGNFAFDLCSSLIEISIPDSVTDIGYCAFMACTALESIIIPAGVTTIDYATFSGCKSLAEITIKNPECEISDYDSTIEPCATIYGYEGSTAQAYAEKYGREFVALQDDDKILDVLSYEIIDGEATITDCDDTFEGEMIIPDTIKGYPVTSIGAEAFVNCITLTGITIPDSVAIIGMDAFAECTSLERITILNSECIIYDDASAIEACATIYGYEGSTAQAYAEKYDREFVALQDDNNKSLEALTYKIVDGEVIITDCDESFVGEMIIPDTIEGYPVTSIDKDTFDNTAISSLIIPATVRNIGDSAFTSCKSLTQITVNKNNKYYSNDERGVLFDKAKTTLIQYPAGNKNIHYVIPDSVTSISKTAFANSLLMSIIIPESVKDIGNEAFSMCTLLTSITIPAGVTNLGATTFYYCYRLKNVTIDADITSIPHGTFIYCSSLESVNIPESVTNIGPLAFLGCTALTNIKIPDSVTVIDELAFTNCESLISIEIPASVTLIEYWAFYNCTALTEVIIGEDDTIKNGTAIITNFAFEGCPSLKNVIIGNSVAIIEQGAFYMCESLNEIIIKNPECAIYDSELTIDPAATIYGYESSTAQSYAEKYGREFVVLTDECEHEYSASVTAPTCTEKGYTTYSCECGDTYIDDYADATGHSHTAAVTTPATHLSEGVMTYTCACGDSYTEAIAKLADHNYSATVTAPSCTENGYTTYSCECGDSYTDDYTEIVDHADNDGDTLCDMCKAEIPKEDETVDCSCNCYQSGFMGFIWKIIKFFYKLFGMIPVCECGAAHY